MRSASQRVSLSPIRVQEELTLSKGIAGMTLSLDGFVNDVNGSVAALERHPNMMASDLEVHHTSRAGYITS